MLGPVVSGGHHSRLSFALVVDSTSRRCAAAALHVSLQTEVHISASLIYTPLLFKVTQHIYIITWCSWCVPVRALHRKPG